ncbi:MAG: ATP-binding cassette domain-containing protein [Flavobacteriales bacterium]|jgi:phospholipid/cholesterol/gamma-HCH transport system ATP-binding protein|nr:ATP-binding cassette domain-containing protein [Flavobacteriales bacterium]MBT6174418.1 ATP-binding cassette domain-containing protein [Flavobacteriales bacterium]
MIELINISKSFGEHHILKNVSAKFHKGKVNFIIGRSGSGKSVMTKCTVGLLEPDEGKVLFDGRDFTAMNQRMRKEVHKEIGMLFQGGALFDSMTVSENIKFPLKMFSDLTDKEMDVRAEDCLKRVMLEGQGDKFTGELSGGMQKRVGIARAISMNPKYLFCDEPNSGLDPQTAIVIDNLIIDITREYGMTTVVVSHDMNSVIEASDTIHFIHEGEIAFEGDNDEMMVSQSETLNEFIYASKLMQKLRDR